MVAHSGVGVIATANFTWLHAALDSFAGVFNPESFLLQFYFFDGDQGIIYYLFFIAINYSNKNFMKRSQKKVCASGAAGIYAKNSKDNGAMQYHCYSEIRLLTS